jgi:formylglycine-generating enzyme required for sulfatase activity
MKRHWLWPGVGLILIVSSLLGQQSAVGGEVLNVAVLDFLNSSDLPEKQVKFLSELVRGVVKKNLPDDLYQIITKEKIDEMLVLKKLSVKDCTGTCEIELARKIGADYFINGELQRLDDELILLVKLYSAGKSSFLNSAEISGKKIGDLKKAMGQQIPTMLEKLPGVIPLLPPPTSLATSSGLDQSIPSYQPSSASGKEAAPAMVGAGQAILNFSTEPGGAEVRLNGKLVGQTTPAYQKTDLKPGKYRLELRLANYRVQSQDIELKADLNALGLFRLEPELGKLTVVVEPATVGVKISLDGVEKGEAPLMLSAIPAGSHELRAQGQGWAGQVTVQVRADATITAVVPLKKSGLVDMVAVKGGCFEMGSNDGDNDEKPVHRVCVGDFSLSKTEVTRGQWAKFVAESGYSTEAERNISFEGCYVDNGSGNWGYQAGTSWRNTNFSQGDNEPVVCVSWHDAAKFANWLSRKDGRAECYDEGNWQLRSGCAGYSLPSEAEWEYAARCGAKGYRYAWGNENPSGRRGGNVGDESLKRKYANFTIFAGYDDGYVYTAPVGSFDPNCYGLYDMTGNVWEWVNDWKNDLYYANSPSSDPQGPSTGSNRVLRGGSWGIDPQNCRAANRGRGVPSKRGDGLGFRLRLSSR